MVHNALELDAGRYVHGGSSATILYATRLALRVGLYARAALAPEAPDPNTNPNPNPNPIPIPIPIPNPNPIPNPSPIPNPNQARAVRGLRYLSDTVRLPSYHPPSTY